MNGLGFEDLKQAILPIVSRNLLTGDGELDSIVRAVVSQLQTPLGFSEQMRELLIEDLRTNFNTTATIPAVLRATDGWVEWLAGRRSSISWGQWYRYRYYLRTVRNWPEPIIQSLDDTSDRILDLLADPALETQTFDRRGLVVGHVQSGKTANYTALINKAFDAGFKVVIVLAGLHNNLRSQTQIRLDEEVIGYTMKDKSPIERFVGVGLMKGYPPTEVISLTNSDNNGDFSAQKARTLFRPPILLVVKKNKTILANLLNYLRNKSPYSKKVEGKKHKVVTDLPLLVIDDEADQASVNTAEIYDDEGNVNPEYDPTQINRLIRDIFHTFEKRAYVGYTATPFANMLIDRDSHTEEHGYDLFPRDFIVSLPKPSNYAGPAEYFDLYDDPDNQQAGLIRRVKQATGFTPVGHKNDHTPGALPDDLVASIYAFLVGTAIRRLRGQANKHSSMLIHVTRFQDVQHRVHALVDEKIKEIKLSVRHGKGKTEHDVKLQQIYEEDFVATSASRRDGGPTFSWEAVRIAINEVFDKPLRVKEINGKSSDVLDYDEHRDDGLYVVAIGGDKLSRGLTLEGLIVSYYLRSTNTYDTLMQMGRWFGYRDGYFDLCRIYTTEELCNWFYKIAIATEDVRGQLVEMAERGLTPDDYVIRINKHPDLKVTSPNKMRSASQVKVSYSTSLVQTTVFENSRAFFVDNFRATEAFIRRLGEPQVGARNAVGDEYSPMVKYSDGQYYWEDVSAEQILDFLSRYKTEDSLGRTSVESWREYILKRAAVGELISWTVVLINSGTGPARRVAGVEVKPVKRVGDRDAYNSSASTVSIRILTTAGHEHLDFTKEQHATALDIIEGGQNQAGRRKEVTSLYAEARKLRSSSRALLLLYPLSTDDPEGVLYSAKRELGLADQELPIGVAISFPESKTNGDERDYLVNRSVNG